MGKQWDWIPTVEKHAKTILAIDEVLCLFGCNLDPSYSSKLCGIANLVLQGGSGSVYRLFTLILGLVAEDLETLWRLIKERFATTKPKNFSDDFLLITLGAMFEKPDIQAQIWKNQRSVHGQANVNSWKLLESCGVQIITFTTTQLILLVERRYPLTRFTLDQMLNNVRLEVKEESEVSLELLSFGVDTAMDFKENMLSV
nr:hypothetical protein [Tanacetum cinerariifolium]